MILKQKLPTVSSLSYSFSFFSCPLVILSIMFFGFVVCSSPFIRFYPMFMFRIADFAILLVSCLLSFTFYSVFRWPRRVWWLRVALLSIVSRGRSPGYTWQQVKRFTLFKMQCSVSGSTWIRIDFAVLCKINLVSCRSKRRLYLCYCGYVFWPIT